MTTQPSKFPWRFQQLVLELVNKELPNREPTVLPDESAVSVQLSSDVNDVSVAKVPLLIYRE